MSRSFTRPVKAITVILVAMSTQANASEQLSAIVEKTELAKGSQVKCKVNVDGSAGIESDLSRSSFSQEVGAGATIEVGPANEAGLYFVKLIQIPKTPVVVPIFIASGAQPGTFFVESLPFKPPIAGKSPKVTEDLIDRFSKAIKKDDYGAIRKAAKLCVTSWLSKNTVGATGTMTICILPVPGARAVCFARIGDHIVDLGFEFTNALIDSTPDLSDKDKGQLRQWLQTGRTIIDLSKIIRADTKLEKVLEAATIGVNLIEFNAKDKSGSVIAASVISNNTAGLVSKTAITIKLVKQ